MVVPCTNSIETTHGLTLLTKYDSKEMKKKITEYLLQIFLYHTFIPYYAQHKVMEFNNTLSTMSIYFVYQRILYIYHTHLQGHSNFYTQQKR